MSEKYNHKEIEKKWQKRWEEQDLYKAEDFSDRPKKYILDMFPYPSAQGLHVGHPEGYTATDIYSRFLRMNGYNVLHPIGWDAFGLPTENYAIKINKNPKEVAANNIKNFKRQIKSLGFSYDWSREINTSDPKYYKWTQWLFLQLYKNGLAYKKKAPVNWCESCKTVLANEQVIDGRCERCKNEVVQKDLEQWFFKITDYAERLLKDLDKIDWPESIKLMQRNWIGRSEGAVIKFQIIDSKQYVEVFTTRPDTLFGTTYLVLAPENPLINDFESQIKNWDEVQKYVKKAKSKTEIQRANLEKEKTGVELKGIKAINPATKEEIPIWVADYVMMSYGTGAVMAVPAHDQRDFEFSRKYNLPVKQVIAPFFISKDKDAPKKGKTSIRRNNIIVIIKHWEDDKIFCLDWGKFQWKSFVIGGIEKGESSKNAAIREMKEETGYQNIKSIRKIGPIIHNNFFAAHKNVNMYSISECYYIELKDDKYIRPKEKDVKNHKGQWISSKDVKSFINLRNHLYYWNVLVDGESAYEGEGVMINSGKFDGIKSQDAKKAITKFIDGEKKVQYKLRDWLVSRQRYWGAPIPIIYCPKCGEVSVPEKDLPVELPDDVDFKPKGESPLVFSKKFHNVKCPKCNTKTRREVDTMDTFVCSSWYFLRYCDPNNEKEPFNKKKVDYWTPIDLYVGGAEHAVLHLLYARFITKFLKDQGFVDIDEPFQKLINQGLILAEDGRKMSKSLGNVINPDDVIEKYGADTLRMYEMFMGPLRDAKPWSTRGIIGVKRFLDRVWEVTLKIKNKKPTSSAVRSKIKITNQNLKIVHKTIKKATEDIKSFNFNTAISAMMIFVNQLSIINYQLSVEDFEKFLIILSPFAPHLAEELWERLGNKESIFKQKWPTYDEKLIKEEEIELVVQVNGKVRDRIKVSPGITEFAAKKVALASDKVKKHLKDKDPKKVIFVRRKLINFVV